MTPDKVRELEHMAIVELCLCETPDGQEKQWLHYIDGINTMASMVIDALEKEEKRDGK